MITLMKKYSQKALKQERRIEAALIDTQQLN